MATLSSAGAAAAAGAAGLTSSFFEHAANASKTMGSKTIGLKEFFTSVSFRLVMTDKKIQFNRFNWSSILFNVASKSATR